MASRTDVWLRKARGDDGFKAQTHRIDAGAVATDGFRIHLVRDAKVGRKDAGAPDELANLMPVKRHQDNITLSGTIRPAMLKKIARFAKRVADAKVVTFYADDEFTAVIRSHEIESCWRFEDGLEWGSGGERFAYTRDQEATALFTMKADQLEDAMMGWDADEDVMFSVSGDPASVIFEGGDRLAMVMQTHLDEGATDVLAKNGVPPERERVPAN